MPEMSAAGRFWCTNPVYRAVARRLVLPWAIRTLSPHGDALEIGSGSGAMAAELLARFPQLRLLATDFDQVMVALAARRLAGFGDRARVELADATALPYDDGGFDLVMSFAMLHHVHDWESALAEAVRVLRPGGRLVGYDLLDSLPLRLVHRLEGGGARMMRLPPLHKELARLPLVEVETTASLAGQVVRFVARRAD